MQYQNFDSLQWNQALWEGIQYVFLNIISKKLLTISNTIQTTPQML